MSTVRISFGGKWIDIGEVVPPLTADERSGKVPLTLERLGLSIQVTTATSTNVNGVMAWVETDRTE